MQTNVLEYLERTAARFPDRVAFADGTCARTFSELLRGSRQLGAALHAQLGAIRRPVAVFGDQTVSAILGFLGVLQSGNFYVPINPKLPPRKRDEMLARISPAAVLFAPEEAGAVRDIACACPVLPTDCAEGAQELPPLPVELRARILDVDPAYMIFTSGSTGTPKGIVISHRSVIDFTDWYVRTMDLRETDVLANQAPLFFDLSVKNLYGTLATGAQTRLLEKKFFLFPTLLLQELNRVGVTVLSWATSAFHLTANSGVLEGRTIPTLRLAVVGGEALRAKQLNLWRRAVPQARYVQLYGPTEVTVDCTCYFIDREFADGEPIPIGRACENKEILLLDAAGREVPPGRSGELCVRGSGLALGYYGEPEKTDRVFTQNPAHNNYRDWIYHTGDYARLGEDGNYYFLSREDRQIKHGGYRIELGEIEAAISGVAGVSAAICLYDGEADRILCFYQGEPAQDALAGELRQRLARYMLPNRYYRMEALPLTANGKIDRGALMEYSHGTN